MSAHAAVAPNDKTAWRTRLLTARRHVPDDVRSLRDRLLGASAGGVARAIPGPVCAYVPLPSEPGGPELVQVLADVVAATGRELLLPVVPPEPGPLDWARFDGSFARGPLGVREPTGPRLGPAAIATAGVVLVPALAVDRRGVRLGRGAGYYDRTLPLARTSHIIAVVDPDELVTRLPAAAHDRRVNAALVAGAGLVTLGKTR